MTKDCLPCGARRAPIAKAQPGQVAKIVYRVEGGDLTETQTVYDYDEAVGIAQESGGRVRSGMEMVTV